MWWNWKYWAAEGWTHKERMDNMKRTGKRLAALLLTAVLTLSLLPATASAADTHTVTLPDTLVGYVVGAEDTPLTGTVAVEEGAYVNIYSADPTAQELAVPFRVTKTDDATTYTEITILHVPTTTSAHKERGNYIQFQMPAYDVTLSPSFTTCLTGVSVEADTAAGALRAVLEPAGATGNCTWFRETEPDTWVAVGSGETYSPKAADVGKRLKVEATGTGAYSGVVSSAPTEAVSASSQVKSVLILREGDPTQPVTIDLTAGIDTVTLNAVIIPGVAAELTWNSSDPDVAAVVGDATAAPGGSGQSASASAVVTGLKAGTATITLSSNGKTDTVEVQVTDDSDDATLPTLLATPDTTTTVTKNEDGSTTTTVTDNKTGTVTATTVDPEGGKVEKVTAADESVTITVTDPDGSTVVSMELPGTMPTLPEDQKFVDVPDSNYAADAINSMAALGIVNGVGDRRFDRISGMKRGDLAAVLYRMSNGGTGYDLLFEDVPSSKYYADGIAWAAEVGVVTGYSESVFAPEETITREQLAVMLYRYAKLLKLDTAASAGALDDFTDGSSTHGWAVEGTAWCVENGILQGRGNGTLDSRSTVIRADVALMLQRFINLMK